MGLPSCFSHPRTKIGILAVWAIFAFIGACCIEGGVQNGLALNFVDIFYGGVDSSLFNGQAVSGTSSRSWSSMLGFMSCSDWYDSVWTNQTISKSGNALLASMYMQHPELADYAYQECTATREIQLWYAGWAMFFMLVLVVVFPVLYVKVPSKASILTLPLAICCLLLVLRNYPGNSVLNQFYDCKGLADDVYGDPTCGGNNLAAVHQAQLASVPAKPWTIRPALFASDDLQVTFNTPTTNFGAILPQCVTTANVADRLQQLYTAPGSICMSDQNGGQQDTALNKHIYHRNTILGGVWLCLITLFCLLGHSAYSVYEVAKAGEDDGMPPVGYQPAPAAVAYQEPNGSQYTAV